MDRFKDFLKKTECCFNWGLNELKVRNCSNGLVKYFRDKVECQESVESEDPLRIWPLRLVYAYEVFKTQPSEALRLVDDVLHEMRGLTDSFTLKYQTPFLHIILSTEAVMLMKRGCDAAEINTILSAVKPKNDMSDVELSGLLALKAHVMRQYGPDGTYKSVPLLRQAIRLNPQEAEWGLSLVASQNRIRHYIKGRGITFDDVREPVNVLQKLLQRPDLTPQQIISCKYYLAVAYWDSNCHRKAVLELCDDIWGSTDHPQILAFCADSFLSQGETLRSQEIIQTALLKFPSHVGINTSACKIYRKSNRLDLAAKYAQAAMDSGGYGAAWLLLQCKVALKEDFDDEAFFNRVLASYESLYIPQTHVSASMYYFCQKRDVVRGACHLKKAIQEDPGFNTLHDYVFVNWIGKKVRPIELAYNQIVRFLKSSHSDEIDETRVIIETVVGEKILNFNTTDDLLQRDPFTPGRRGRR